MDSIRRPEHKLLLLATCALSLLSFSPALWAADGNAPESKNRNFIRNESFERVLPNGQPEAWTVRLYGTREDQKKRDAALAKIFSITDAQAHTGKKSFRIDLTAFNAYEEFPKDTVGKPRNEGIVELLWGQGLKGDFASLKGKKVRLTVWVYYEYIPEHYWLCPNYRIRANPLESPLSLTVSSDLLESQGHFSIDEKMGKWIKVEKEGKMPAEATDILDLWCGLRLNRNGERNLICVYMDDISLRVVENE